MNAPVGGGACQVPWSWGNGQLSWPLDGLTPRSTSALRAPQQGEALFIRGGNSLEETQPFPGSSGPSSDRCPGARLGVLQTTPGCFPEKQAECSLAPSLPGLAAPYTRLALFGLTSKINCLTLKPHLWARFWGNPNQDTVWRACVVCTHVVCMRVHMQA